MKKWKFLVPVAACSIMLAAVPLMQAEEQQNQQQIFTDTKDNDTNANGNLSIPPEIPSGSAVGGSMGTPPQMPSGSAVGGSMGTPPDGTNGGIMPGETPGGAPGASQGVDSYDAVNSVTTDTRISGAIISSTGKDENAILVQGADAVIEDTAVSRVSNSSTGGDSSSFYGVGAAILATDGTMVIKNSEIATDAAGGAGVFSYGSAVTYVEDTVIKTVKDTSGGIHAAGGGTLYAWNVTAETNGESSAAIRSDRGGGTMVVDQGTYTSNGTGSPAVYSTADISIHDAELTANNSEAVCIEGLNSIHMFDCNLTGNMPKDNRNECIWNVILYQSMSGDSVVGNSSFEMNGGTLTAKNGGMFYTTNTESTFVLKDVDITYADNNPFFLRCTGNTNQRGWGTSGKNGADCLFTAYSQDMQGNIVWDSISSLNFYMADGSILKGAVVDDESCAGDGGNGYCKLYISKDSKWIVTGDSTLTSLSCAGTIEDADGKTVTIKGTDGTIYKQGDSTYAITVENYTDAVDMSGAAAVTQWSDYAVEKKDTSSITNTGNITTDTTETDDTNNNINNNNQQTDTFDTKTVKKTKIKSVTRNKNGKKAVVTLKKVSGAEGYKIRYSTNKSFKKAVTKIVSSAGTKKTLKKLKTGKVYYISARAFKTVDGEKVYSKWSAAKLCK